MNSPILEQTNAHRRGFELAIGADKTRFCAFLCANRIIVLCSKASTLDQFAIRGTWKF